MINQNKLYIISDLHYYHKNIIKYCNRPYSLEEIPKMNEDILAEFDKLPEGSTILNLGDLYLSFNKTFDDIKYLVDRMKANNKRLEILLGNHDRTVPRYMKGYKEKTAVELFQELGFDKVYKEPFEEDGMIFCHEPIYTTDKLVVHGHVHDKDVDENYFNHECDNWAMIEVVKNHPELEHSEECANIKTGIVRTDRKIDPSNYYNVCWDKTHRIINYEEVKSWAASKNKESI